MEIAKYCLKILGCGLQKINLTASPQTIIRKTLTLSTKAF